ncbi:hypothetical protein [Enhygromyxa salina]|uniref:hypothetical protein n=1 Tax=Enhygromyxa salina TaxID=215803 RepID=UPI0015E60DDB|nr:hypothetical protein [Enhygromyxa salina]
MLLLALSVGLGPAGCSDDAPAEDTSGETGDGDGDTGDGDSGDSETGDGDGDGDGDPGDGDGDGDFPGTPPENFCPGDPDGNCDEVPDAPLRAGTAVVDLVPECFESWTDVAQNGDFDEGEDDFLDCGCDRLCPMDPGYVAPDEGENDGVFQAIYMAGFQNNRPATGVRDDSVGLVGEGDGIWCKAVVLDQGNTRVAIVTLDTIGYFYDEVVAIRETLGDQDIDWLVVHSIHNHEGPDTMGLWGESMFSGGFDPDYRAQIRLAVASAVTDAVADLEEVATLTVGRGDASTAHQGDPAKGIRNVSNDTRAPFIVDEAVDVLNFKNGEGESIVTLINFASHPESLASEQTLLTADYVHALRKTVEQGSQWQAAPATAGLGGEAIFISGALGGMMTPLRISTTTPDGDTWNTGEFEKADAIGQLLGEIAIDAIHNGEVIENPRLEFASQTYLAEVINDGFKLLFMQSIFDREVIERDNKMYVRTEMGALELGPVRMLTIPGELLPELAVGGYDGSQMFTTEVELIEPDNPNPPDLDAAPEGPYLKERMAADYTWLIGLGNDELGYIVPKYNFELGDLPYLSEAEGDHYEETNSLGPHMADFVNDNGDSLIEFIDWL